MPSPNHYLDSTETNHDHPCQVYSSSPLLTQRNWPYPKNSVLRLKSRLLFLIQMNRSEIYLSKHVTGRCLSFAEFSRFQQSCRQHFICWHPNYSELWNIYLLSLHRESLNLQGG